MSVSHDMAACFSGSADERTFCRLCLSARHIAYKAFFEGFGAFFKCLLGTRIVAAATSGFFCFQPLMSLLHTNRRYDLPLPGAAKVVVSVAPYWLIIPSIGVQKAHKVLEINKTPFYE